MVFVRAWRRRAAAACCRRGVPKAASASRPDGGATARPSAGRNAARDLTMSPSLARLKTRADFLRVAAVRGRAVRPGFVLQAAGRPASSGVDAGVRVGFTASRKVGNAVLRNRAKRRLRAAAAAILPRLGRPGTDYVLVARGETAHRSFAELLADLESAVRQLDRMRQPDAGRARRREENEDGG